MTIVRWIAICAAGVWALACGNSGGSQTDAPGNSPDAPAAIDSNPNLPDAPLTIDSDPTLPDALVADAASTVDARPRPDADPNAPDAGPCQFVSESESAAANAIRLNYTALDQIAEPNNRLVIEQFYQLEFGIKRPHTKVLGPQERQYSTCGECILIYEGCSGQTCQKTFLAQDGVLDITAVDDPCRPPDGGMVRFEGTLSSMSFIEVTIDNNNVSTPVPNGEHRCVDSYAFATNIACR